jgi:predicted metal-binding protein
MREVIAGYNSALLIHCTGTGSPTDIVCKLEREIFLAGFYKAFSLGAGPCKMCTCDLKKCAHADHHRPSVDSCGIDVYATVRANGYPIEVVKHHCDEANFHGLVLLE